MNALSARVAKLGLAAAIAIVLAMAPGPFAGFGDGTAWAQYGSRSSKNKNDERPKKKTRKVETLSPKVYEKLKKAQEFMETEDYASALEMINDAAKIRRLKAYDQAMIHQMYGYVYSTQENYKAAIVEFEKLLAVGGEHVPEGVVTSTLYNLAQMYMILEQWQKGVDTLKRWFAVAPDPGPEAYILMAQGYAQMENWKKALPPAERALSLSQERGQTPRESWYQLVMAIYFEMQNYPKVAEILETLVKLYPKKTYWLQLSAVYGELKREMDQLAIMEVAYMQGYLTKSSELVNLAQLFLFHEVPYKAAKVLDKGLKSGLIEPKKDNWELLANAWINAAEVDKAIPNLEKAASMAEDGELYIRLGQAYMEKEEWSKAAKAFKNAIAKGKLKRPGMASLLLGMANFHSNRFAEARKAFREARKDKRTRKTAGQWLNYLVREEQKRKNQN